MITGETHMTPFMRKSSPILNILWAFVNILLGLILLGPKIVDKWNTFTALEVLKVTGHLQQLHMVFLNQFPDVV